MPSIRTAARSNVWRLAFGLLVGLAATSCDPGASVPGEAGPLVLGAEDVHVVGTSEVVGEVVDLQLMPDSSVWVLNSVAPFFIGFGPDGRVVAEYGAEGGGPEEFRWPAGFVTGGIDGDAWAFDFLRHTFIRVTPVGSEWAEIPLPREQVPQGSVRGGMNILSSGVRTARLGNEIIVPWTTGTMESGVAAYRMSILGADMAALDVGTGEVRSVLTLSEVLGDPSADFVATDGAFPLWNRLWAVCGNDIRVYDRTRNELRGFTANGEEVGPVALPPVRLTRATPEEFVRAVFPLRQAEVTGGVGSRLTSEDSLRLVRESVQEIQGDPEELAAYLPRYVDFRCSDDGAMWLQPVDLDAGGLKGASEWLRIAPDGTAREVAFPPRFDPMLFTSHRVWGIQRDELDVASVAWLPLP